MALCEFKIRVRLELVGMIQAQVFFEKEPH